MNKLYEQKHLVDVLFCLTAFYFRVFATCCVLKVWIESSAVGLYYDHTNNEFTNISHVT